MSKTTFEGYVPSLKARHEANIVGGKAIQSKGGSIRYMLQGEYDGRKTLPKTVTKGDFENVYGFDAKEAEAVIIVGSKDGKTTNKAHSIGAKDKDDFIPEVIVPMEQKIGDKELIDYAFENHADTVGSPSPADVQPPAPSDTPFPQEPSNENFSAPLFRKKYTPQQLEKMNEEKLRKLLIKTIRKNGLEDSFTKKFGKETLEEAIGTDEYNGLDYQNLVYEILEAQKKSAEHTDYEKMRIEFEENADDMDTDELIEARMKAAKEEGLEDWENDSLGNRLSGQIQELIWERNDAENSEVKEAFGLFGKKDEEEKEESDEPKTKEYTVVLQEGDKLELTDLPGDDPEKNEEDKDESEEKDEKEGETYEAVQAKVTRIEDEKEEPEEEESDEGLLTPKNLAIGAMLGVGALALTLGAEDEESDYWHDEGEYSMNAEGVYEAEVNVGEKRVMSRKDYDIDNELTGFSNMEVGDIDLDDYEDEITDSVEDEVIEAIRESVDDAMPISDGESISSSVNVDTEIEITVPISGEIDYDWTANETYEEEWGDDEWNAEEVSEIEYDEYLDELGSDALVLYKDNPSHLFEKAYPIDYEVGMNDYESSLLADIQSGYTENSMMFDEDENLTPYGESVLKEMYDSMIDEALGIEWLADRHPPSELLKRGDPTAYRVGMSEYEDAFESESDAYAYAYSRGHIDGSKKPMEYKPIIRSKDEDKYRRIIQQKAEDFQNMTPSEFVPFDQMQEELGQMWDETTAPLADAHNYDYEPSNEPSNANFSAEDNIKRFKVGERYTHRYHHGHGFYDNEIMRRTDKTVWTSQVNPRTGEVDSPLLVSKHKIHVSQPFELDGEIVSGEESYGLGNHGYRVKAGQTTMTKYADTVGSPSPSGPSSTPEPAEATGSEPSNENFESQDTGNLKLIGGIGLVAAGLFALGKSDWVADMMNKYMK